MWCDENMPRAIKKNEAMPQSGAVNGPTPGAIVPGAWSRELIHGFSSHEWPR